MKLNYYLIGAMALFFLCFSSCGKDEKKEESIQGVEVSIPPLNQWVYFSFDGNKTLSLTEAQAKDSKSWDIAFHIGDIRVNGSEGFQGKASIFETGTTDFSSVSIDTPHKNMVGNKLTSIIVAADRTKGPSGEMIHEDQYATGLHTFTIDFHKMIVERRPRESFEQNNHVFIVCAADGKTMYKMQTISIFDKMGKLMKTLTLRIEKL